jgi:hypothetical protein
MSLKNEEHNGIRLQPIVQSGLISGVLPLKESNYPYGIQTDIVGTSGSSGSPLMDKNLEVLRIAQRSIFGHTPLVKYENMEEYYEGKIHPVENFYAMAEIGLIHGISNNLLHPPFERREEIFQSSSSFIFDTELTIIEKISYHGSKLNEMTIAMVAKKIEL